MTSQKKIETKYQKLHYLLNTLSHLISLIRKEDDKSVFLSGIFEDYYYLSTLGFNSLVTKYFNENDKKKYIIENYKDYETIILRLQEIVSQCSHQVIDNKIKSIEQIYNQYENELLESSFIQETNKIENKLKIYKRE